MNKELNDLHSSPINVRVKEPRMRYARHVARMGERRILDFGEET